LAFYRSIDVLRFDGSDSIAVSIQIDGVEAAWDRVVRTGEFDPDEGLCTIVIGVAGRHNRPDLATSVMENLGRQGIVPKEYHFPPLLEALCGSGRVSDAMEVLTAMRRSGFHADLVAAEPIVGALSKSADDVDKGFYGLQALRTTGKQVDVAAFNAVLKAAEMLGDANRAMVIYRQAEGLGVVPNLETYHVLLSACASAGAVPQAEYLLGDMEKRGDGVADGVTTTSLSSSFDATTYALLVDLYLTGSDYEKAFEYLEVMKAKGIRPPLSVYEGLVKKCVAEADSRSQPLLQEMQAGQYKPSATLIEYVRRVAGAGSRRPEGEEGGGHEKKPRRVESSSGPRRSSRTSPSSSESVAKGEARKAQESTEGSAA
jgi:pentatricopeptide repeat protein